MSKIKHNEGIRKAYNKTANLRQKIKKRKCRNNENVKKEEKSGLRRNLYIIYRFAHIITLIVLWQKF